MGQVHHAHHTEHEPKAQGDNGIGAASHDPIHELLDELFHVWLPRTLH
jgi:hypothetical protein